MKISIKLGYEIEYVEDFWSTGEQEEIYSQLLATKMTPEIIKLYGRTHETKRLSAQYGRDYNYNPMSKPAEEWTPVMLRIKEKMELAAGSLSGGLVQIYPDGSSGIGWHFDKGDPQVIASMSLGAEREFIFGEPNGKSCVEVFRMKLKSGSLVLIPASVNAVLKHSLPVSKKIKDSRINVTLRRFP